MNEFTIKFIIIFICWWIIHIIDYTNTVLTIKRENNIDLEINPLPKWLFKKLNNYTHILIDTIIVGFVFLLFYFAYQHNIKESIIIFTFSILIAIYAGMVLDMVINSLYKKRHNVKTKLIPLDEKEE